MMPGSKGQKAVHACMIRLLNLGPAKHEEGVICAANQRIPNVCRIAGAACCRAHVFCFTAYILSLSRLQTVPKRHMDFHSLLLLRKKTDHITTLYALSFYSYKSSCSFTLLLSAMHCFKATIIFSASSGFAR